ncbi:MAG: ABC transporter permease [Ardenticatenaceae bacterium]
MLLQIYAIFIKELKILLRDPNGLVALFALPVIFIAVMSSAQQSAFDAITGDDPIAVLVINQDGGGLAAQAIADLGEADNLLLVERVEGKTITLDEADGLVARGAYPLAVLFPADFSQRISQAALDSGTQKVEVTFIADPAASLPLVTASESTIEGFVRRTVAYAQIPVQVEDSLEGLAEEQVSAELAAVAEEQVGKAIQGQIEGTFAELGEVLVEQLTFFLDEYTRRTFFEQLEAPSVVLSDEANERVESVFDEVLVERLPTQLAPFLDNMIGDFVADAVEPTSQQVEGPPSIPPNTPHASGRWGEVDEARVALDKGDLLDKLEINLPTSKRDAGLRFEEVPPTGLSVSKRPDSVQQNVPAWTIFGIFFIIQTMAASLLREKQEGTFRRLLVAPLSRHALLIGSLLPYYVVNLIQVGLMFAIGTLVFGLHLGNNPLALLIVSLATAAASLGLGLFVASVAKTTEQVNGLALLLITTLAAMGGIMVSRIFMPKLMQQFTHFTPHAWALDGYHDVIVRGLGINAVLTEIGVLLAFALTFFAFALWRFRFD